VDGSGSRARSSARCPQTAAKCCNVSVTTQFGCRARGRGAAVMVRGIQGMVAVGSVPRCCCRAVLFKV
jgi:hypothetical protein